MKLRLWLLFIALCIPAYVQSAVPSRMVGLVGVCDTTVSGCVAIPLTVTALCGPAGGGCPNRIAQSFTDALRFWGGGGSSCRTSSDGGVTWGNCTTQPLSSGAQEQYAGAGDGSVIALGTIGVTCTIKRSTDNAANWTTVFTDGNNIGCGGAVSGGSRLKCLSDGRCNFLFNNNNTTFPGLLSSTDYGQNWALTTVGVAGNTPVSLAWDGTAGILTSNGLRSLKYTGSWSQGTVAFAGCGTISGSVVYNSVGYGLCKDPGANETFRLMTADGALFQAVTLTGAYTAGGVGILGMSVGTNNLYLLANVPGAQLALGVWVSRDAGSTFSLIYTSSTALNSFTAFSDILYSNGCIYFAGGVSPMMGKIC